MASMKEALKFLTWGYWRLRRATARRRRGYNWAAGHLLRGGPVHELAQCVDAHVAARTYDAFAVGAERAMIDYQNLLHRRPPLKV